MPARLSLPVFLVSLFIFIFAFTALCVFQVHATSTTSVTVTSFPSTGLGYVTVDGSAIATPATFTWTVGDNHTIAANSPVTVVPDKSRHVYSGWSDGGEQSHTIIVPSQATTYSADFQLQYYLNVSGGYSTTGQGWYNNGTSTTASSNWLQSVQGNTTGQVGLWYFDEGTGTMAGDSSGNGNDGVVNGDATWVAGKYGNALSFDGTSGYVNAPDSPTLNMHSQITIETWIYPGAVGNEMGLISKYWTQYYLRLGVGARAEGSVFIEGNRDYRIYGTTTLSTGRWYYVVFTYDGQNMRIYVNGNQENSVALTGLIASTTQPLTIGQLGNQQQFFNGTIDEARIYNRAFSASEIQSLYYSRMAVTNWQLDGTNQNPARSNTGNLTTSNITMSAYHTVTFVSTTQYYLAVSGGNGTTFGTASPTSDNWYDSGSITTISSNWIWGGTSGQSRTAITNWQLDGTNQNSTRQNSGTLTTSSITMSTYHTVTFLPVTQYYLAVNGGNSISFGAASPTGDQWYDSGASTTVSSNWVWSTVAGQSRTAITNYAIDSANQNPARQGSGTLTTSSITMSAYHTVALASVTQYCLTVDGGNSITFGTASPTSDNWYDSGSITTISSNWIWGGTSGQSRTAITNWQLDGTNQNPARQNTGTLTTSSITMNTYHAVTFVSIAQYLVSFQCMDHSGTETITPSSFQIEINNVSAIGVSDFKIWLDNETEFQINSIIWENADVKPTNQQLYVANTPLTQTILGKVFDAKFVVTDYLGIPISDAQVFFTLANGTTIQLTTGSDGTLSLGLIPIGTFHATISYLGTATEIYCDASIQSVVIGKIFASYPTFSLIGGGIIATVAGCMVVRWYRRSPPLRAKVKGYVKVNWGAPFVLGFMILLMAAAVCLVGGLDFLANEVAVYAYYLLVAGVVLQLISFLRRRRENSEQE